MRAFRYMADVSSNNGRVDVNAYADAGHALLAIKATEGVGYTNPFHKPQADAAHRRGLTVAHYHFCRPANHAAAELAHFRSVYRQAWRAGDYVVLDLEVNEGPDVAAYARTFMGELLRETGHPPILYTYASFRTEHLSRVKVPGGRWWMAKYSHPAPSGASWAWQFTDGQAGPEPHVFAGIGHSDGSIVTLGVSARAWIRKKRTGRR